MGVNNLWSVVQPCARPVKIETLNKKRLAVDASIWIYQFLKAVRDKEGNALRNSHVVGFFRRICKLLFFGIKPIFVFDGGAPALKRQTISGRKARREGRREDAVRTAGKLLAVQMQRRAEEERQKKRDEREQRSRGGEEEAPLPEKLVYAEENHMTERERQANRTFKKRDAYHLPDLDVSLSEMGAPNDPRIMSLEELQQYARQFDTGEDVNVYDFSKIDFDSAFFVSLPANDRYNILNAARLRSRLRMGYSKDQLDTMFPDRMAFSRFQIERVRERNDLTQRLMHVNGMSDEGMFGAGAAQRVAGEKGREYVLVKNDGVEGGWALGVVSKDEGDRNKPIDVDKPDPQDDQGDDEWEEEDDFEDVPIGGLNRLPKRDAANGTGMGTIDNLAKRRNRIYKSRKRAGNRPARPAPVVPDDGDSLFVAQPAQEIGENDDAMAVSDDEARELQRAIQLSLQNDQADAAEGSEEEEFEDIPVFQQTRASDAAPFAKGSGLAVARQANNRASKVMPSGPFVDSDDEAEDLAPRSRIGPTQKSGDTPTAVVSEQRRPDATRQHGSDSPTLIAKAAGFDGPLPFEKLDLGTSLLGRKKMKQLEEAAQGGFEKDAGDQKKETATPLPPWFSSNMQQDLNAQKAIEERDRDEERKAEQKEQEAGLFEFQQSTLRREDTREVVDLEAEPERSQQVIEVESDDDTAVEPDEVHEPPQLILEDPELRMGDLADKVRAEPPVPEVSEPVEALAPEKGAQDATNVQNLRPQAGVSETPNTDEGDREIDAEEEEQIEWSESDAEDTRARRPVEATAATERTESQAETRPSSPDEFEDVPMRNGTPPLVEGEPESTGQEVEPQDKGGPIPASGLANDNLPATGAEDEEVDMVYSDPEDEELFRQLAQEEEEYARFASSLNNNMTSAPVDYEKELRQLRNQQKKDRRDADEVTKVMVQECQQLLGLFGLPYITAPMEAEAQCAELTRLGLVDGIVTDDSDIFLFGGTRIYKNMFNQAKFVECYLEQDLQSEVGLNREKMIGLAQLLGSDYTEGLPNVGPVTAVEILSEFGDLERFKTWWTAVQNGSRSKEQDAAMPFRKKFRRNAKKLFLPPAFPDPRVEQAYLKPDVDADPQQFVWGVPDLGALRAFLMATIGWSQERTDEILVPVIKDMNRRIDEGTQANITNFFGGGVGAGAFAPRRREEGKSKRLETALSRMKEKSRTDAYAEGDSTEPAAQASEAPLRDALLSYGKGKRKKPSKSKTLPRPDREDEDSDANDHEGSSEASGDDYVDRPKKSKKTKHRTAKSRT